MAGYRGASDANTAGLRSVAGRLTRVSTDVDRTAGDVHRLASEASGTTGDNRLAGELKSKLLQIESALANARRQVDEGALILANLAGHLDAVDNHALQYEWALCALPDAVQGGLNQSQALSQYSVSQQRGHSFRSEAARAFNSSSGRTVLSSHHPSAARKFLDGALHGIGSFAKGVFVDGVGGVIGGVADLVTGKVHLGDAFDALRADPSAFLGKTVDVLLHKELWDKDKARWAGAVIFDVGTLLIGVGEVKGALKGVEGIESAGKVGQAGKDLDAIGELGRVGKGLGSLSDEWTRLGGKLEEFNAQKLADIDFTKGHAIEEHVGLTEKGLADGAAIRPGSTMSTFASEASMRAAVGRTLDDNAAAIGEWLKSNPKSTKAFTSEFPTSVGHGITTSGDPFSSTTVKVVLKPSSSAGGYDILTAYPMK